MTEYLLGGRYVLRTKRYKHGIGPGTLRLRVPLAIGTSYLPKLLHALPLLVVLVLSTSVACFFKRAFTLWG
jgi:hypothetical protein